MSLRRRIKVLEAKRGGDDLMIIIVSGGCPPEPEEITDARPGETFEDYCARRQVEAQAAGQKILVIQKWDRVREERGDFCQLETSPSCECDRTA
jgi:hypothetical protein